MPNNFAIARRRMETARANGGYTPAATLLAYAPQSIVQDALEYALNLKGAVETNTGQDAESFYTHSIYRLNLDNDLYTAAIDYIRMNGGEK